MDLKIKFSPKIFIPHDNVNLKTTIQLNNYNIDEVSSFNYLGVMINNKLDANKSVTEQLQHYRPKGIYQTLREQTLTSLNITQNNLIRIIIGLKRNLHMSTILHYLKIDTIN